MAMEVHEYCNVYALNPEFDEINGMWLNTTFCSDTAQQSAQSALVYPSDPTLTAATTQHPASGPSVYQSLALASTPSSSTRSNESLAYSSHSTHHPLPTPPEPLLFFPSQLCSTQSSIQSFECNLAGPHFLSDKMGLLPSHLPNSYLTQCAPCTSLQSCFPSGTLEQLNPLNEAYSNQFPVSIPVPSIYESCSPTSSDSSAVQSDSSAVKAVRARKRTIGRNQLGRAFSPGIPLSLSERQFIVRLYQEGWRICDISRRLAVTHSCVSKILQRYRKTGSVKPKDAKEGRPEGPLVTAIRDYYKRLGIYSQTEIRAQLLRDGLCTRDTLPSRSSINHILRTKFDIRKRRGNQEK
ncbi:unnamed protein product, partial [Mesorhabditis belari]|uniref:Paired domain-containing protein n=1 Tax=Mesorhabditis belari TaxID=2138241 RepID=A0AAF3FJZ3_9BILA